MAYRRVTVFRISSASETPQIIRAPRSGQVPRIFRSLPTAAGCNNLHDSGYQEGCPGNSPGEDVEDVALLTSALRSYRESGSDS